MGNVEWHHLKGPGGFQGPGTELQEGGRVSSAGSQMQGDQINGPEKSAASNPWRNVASADRFASIQDRVVMCTIYFPCTVMF